LSVRTTTLLLLLLLAGCSEENGSPNSGRQRPQPAASKTQESIAPELKPYYEALQRGEYASVRSALGQLDLPWNREGQRSFLLGFSYHEERLHDQALKHFARAQELSPGFLPTYYYQGMSALDAGELKLAAQALDRYLEAKPDQPSALFGRALVALEEDELQLARQHLERAMALTELRTKVPQTAADAQQDLGRYLARLADLCVREGKLTEARAALERASALIPDYAEVWSKLARVCTDLGDTQAAEQAQARWRALEAQRSR
jgi:tetratricopeptide (TPR) repeat protein